MLARFFEKSSAAISALMAKKLSQAQLALLCKLLIVAMLVPLVLIAPYNYPADDDFGFVLPASEAWVATGSVWEVLKAIVGKVVETYQTWQGYFVSTFLFCVTPMVFDIDLYFLGNYAMLAMLCLSVGYLVNSVIKLLNANRDTFWIVYTACLVLVLQFMPAIAYSVYWHNGGQYTTAACTLFVTFGLLLRCTMPQSRARSLWRMIALALCGFMLGGSFFGPALGALVLIAVCAIAAVATRSKARPYCFTALAFFASAFAISVMAPGNALRQERTGQSVSVVSTLITTALDSFDLAGQWMSPQLLAMLLLICAVLWLPLRESGFSFKHPLCVMIGLYGLFSASLAPGVYTGVGYTYERYFNAIYLYFLVCAIGTVIYAEGWLIRKMEASQWLVRVPQEPLQQLGKRFACGFLALVMALTIFGGFAFTIMNTSSISALKSLVTGEAAQFKADMAQRQEYIRTTNSDVVNVTPLDSQPFVFKRDQLPWQGIYGRVRYMKWYFELFYNAEHPQ